MLTESIKDARILVVDDDKTNLQVIEGILRREGYLNVRPLADPREINHVFAEYQPDIVLLDLFMPHLNGYDVIERLKARTPSDEYLPILVLTADTNPSARQRALRAGAKDFLTKPYNPTEVVLRIGNLLETRMLSVKLHQYALDLETKILQRTNEMAKTEAKYQLLVEQIPVIIYSTTVEENPKVTYISPQIEALLGFSQKEWIDNPVLWQKQIVSVDQDLVLEHRKRLYKTGASFNLEYRMLSAAGNIIWVRDEATIERDTAYRPCCIHGVISNISERKLVEAQLTQAQRLESLAHLANGFALDLNNSLAPILMSVQILRQEVLSVQGNKLLDTLESSTRRSASIVKQVLSFSNLAEGRRSPIQIAHLLTELAEVLHNSFPKNIRIQLECNDKLLQIEGIWEQLSQMLMNLCVNAKDAMPDGGALSIKAHNTSVAKPMIGTFLDSYPGHFVFIEVSDTGSGIPNTVFEHIFEPFYTTKSEKGTGLGLSTVMRIVKDHHGFIQINNVIGKGASFGIYLPAYHCTQDAIDSTDSVSDYVGHNECILVVDDETDILNIIQQSLLANGYNAVMARNGKEALSLLYQASNSFQVAVIDLIMPGISGEKLINTIKQLNLPIKILAMTGSNSEFNSERIKEIGADAFLYKPFSTNDLLKTISMLLRKI